MPEVATEPPARVVGTVWRRVGDLLVVAVAIGIDLLTWAGDRATVDGPMLPLVIIPLVTVLVDATLLLRWRWPLAVFALQWLFPFACLLVPEFQPFAGVLVALHALAARRPAARSAPALVSLVIPFGLYGLVAARTGDGDPRLDFGAVLLLWLLLATAAWGVGRLSYVAARRHQRLAELQAAEAAAAVAAERMRLARELHDIVAHTVTIMMIQATGAKAVLEPGQPTVRKALEVIEDSGIQAMSELHRMLRLLRMPDDADGAGPPGQPGLAELQHLVATAVQTGRDVELVEDGVPGAVDPSVAGTAYRVVQEALTNAAKHGGPQADVRVRLGWTPTALEVEVTDHERGPKLTAEQTAALSSGSGLRGLRERVIMVGGTFQAGPVPGGYVVRARLPRHGVRSPDLAEAGHAR